MSIIYRKISVPIHSRTFFGSGYYRIWYIDELHGLLVPFGTHKFPSNRPGITCMNQPLALSRADEWINFRKKCLYSDCLVYTTPYCMKKNAPKSKSQKTHFLTTCQLP